MISCDRYRDGYSDRSEQHHRDSDGRIEQHRHSYDCMEVNHDNYNQRPWSHEGYGNERQHGHQRPDQLHPDLAHDKSTVLAAVRQNATELWNRLEGFDKEQNSGQATGKIYTDLSQCTPWMNCTLGSGSL